MTLILSSEHGGNQIPVNYSSLFQGQEEILASHRGYDPGTEDLYDFLLPHAFFGIKNTFSRLLIEFNRSEWSKQLFSSISQELPEEDKVTLLQDYYRPYRRALGNVIEDELHRSHWVLHISLHSFTPNLGLEQRNNDFGLLYDPRRAHEKRWAQSFASQLGKHLSEYRVRMNYPYLGKADGLTSYFRKKYPERYLGIELEINQKWVIDNRFPEAMKLGLKLCLLACVKDF